MNRRTLLRSLFVFAASSTAGAQQPAKVYRIGFLGPANPSSWAREIAALNIEDKKKLYSEINRVLGPGGRFAFQEMVAGRVATSYFPLPWATDAADNFLVTAEEMRSLLGENGFVAEVFEDTSDAHLSGAAANATPAAPGQLSLGVYVDNLAQKAANARRSLEEGQVRLVRGVFRVK